MQYLGFCVKQHLWVRSSVFSQLRGCWVSRKKACIAFPLISLSIPALIWHLTNRRARCFGSCRCSLGSAASCGRLGPLPEEASFSSNNESNIDIYLINPTFQASCKRSLALLLRRVLYQLPDYAAVMHPKDGVKRMWGRRRKSPSSHSHTDGFHMGFWRKAPQDPSTQTTVNSLLLPWHNHWSALPFLTIRFLLWGYNRWPAHSVEVSRSVRFDWPISK